MDGSWNSGAVYTQASYLDTITNTEGYVIEFALNNEATEPCDPNEYVIPFQSAAGVEDQGYFNVYEKRFLKTVTVNKMSSGITNMIRQFQLGYSTINQSISGAFRKRLLENITEIGSAGTKQIKCCITVKWKNPIFIYKKKYSLRPGTYNNVAALCRFRILYKC
jgi:hypothetical protein